MKIKFIDIRQGFFARKFDFSNGINLIYSTENSVGKTTLLRLIFWGLGYDIPSTRKFNFNTCSTQMQIELDNSTQLDVYRSRDTLIVNDGHEEFCYSLPMEAINFHSIIFNSDNIDILNNLLGAIYLDQEKGWTLLNRGCVIGKIRFNVESLIRGLSKIDCQSLIEEDKNLESEIIKYRKMLDIAEYQRQINEVSGNITYRLRDDDIRTKIAFLKYQQSQIEDEIKKINGIIKENNSFKNFIEKMRLTVVSPSGEEIPVNKTTIVGYEDVQQITIARKRIELNRLQEIKKQLEKLVIEIDDSDMFVKVETLIESFDAQISNISIDAIAVSNVIEQLKKRRKEILAVIETKTKVNNTIADDLFKTAFSYMKELGVDKYTDKSANYIFTHDLKSLSGAVLHLTVFAFRLAYIKAIENSLNITLPILIDSPSGKEILRDNVEKMIDILERDFANNQIIMASIYKYNIAKLKVHAIKNSLMGESFQ